jgi:hypothetical protein
MTEEMSSVIPVMCKKGQEQQDDCDGQMEVFGLFQRLHTSVIENSIEISKLL